MKTDDSHITRPHHDQGAHDLSAHMAHCQGPTVWISPPDPGWFKTPATKRSSRRARVAGEQHTPLPLPG